MISPSAEIRERLETAIRDEGATYILDRCAHYDLLVEVRDLLASQSRAMEEAQRERDELQTARNDLWTHWNTRDLACREAEARAEQAEAARERLREALLKYGQHQDGCPRQVTGECKCGFASAIYAAALATTVRPTEDQ